MPQFFVTTTESERPCVMCDGTGRVAVPSHEGGGHVACPLCQGAGVLDHHLASLLDALCSLGVLDRLAALESDVRHLEARRPK